MIFLLSSLKLFDHFLIFFALSKVYKDSLIATPAFKSQDAIKNRRISFYFRPLLLPILLKMK